MNTLLNIRTSLSGAQRPVLAARRSLRGRLAGSSILTDES